MQNKPQIQKDKKIKILIIQDENNLRNHFLSKLKVVLKEIGFQFDEMKKNDFKTISAIDQKGDFYIVSFDTNENNGKNGNNNDLLVLLDEINNIPIEQKNSPQNRKSFRKRNRPNRFQFISRENKANTNHFKRQLCLCSFFLKQPKNSITRDKIQNFKTDAFGNIIWSDIAKTK
ncbi:hypothetical protein [Vaccinium witches'-broom phytoplasma]|uniref:hypothetical protein n=1 Tax=Vaccinium witches'-broom phytoplasma TaxID=85642 RepID=UPI00036171FC|nr:hypothetical protein [Vaccinium witches'-broom phytoplasma]